MRKLVVMEKPEDGLLDALAAAVSGRRDAADITLISAQNGAENVRECDIAVISPGYREGKSLKCKALVMPDGGSDCGIDTHEIITYGMSPRATLSLSSVSGRQCMLDIRREIVTLGGERIDECEICVPMDYPAERELAVCGALILLGIIKDKSAYYMASHMRKGEIYGD